MQINRKGESCRKIVHRRQLPHPKWLHLRSLLSRRASTWAGVVVFTGSRCQSPHRLIRNTRPSCAVPRAAIQAPFSRTLILNLPTPSRASAISSRTVSLRLVLGWFFLSSRSPFPSTHRICPASLHKNRYPLNSRVLQHSLGGQTGLAHRPKSWKWTRRRFAFPKRYT